MGAVKLAAVGIGAHMRRESDSWKGLDLAPQARTREAASVRKWWSWGLAAMRIGCTARTG